MAKFTHLHLHTQYSLLDGFVRIEELPARLKELEMDSVAITDHGAMFGVPAFYDACRKEGIKPIIGCEIYVARRGMHDKEGKLDTDPYHLILLAKDNEGYKNLMKIVSLGYTEGFYYRPRVDKEVLRRHCGGLIALSACLGGEIPTMIMQQRMQEAREAVRTYIDIFGAENFFFELQDNGIDEQKIVNAWLKEHSKEFGVGLVATNDVHYMEEKDAYAHDVLLCIQTNAKVDDENRMRFSSDTFYLRSAEDMAEAFKDCPEAIESTQKIAQMCNVEFEYDQMHLPHFEVPEGESSESYLHKLCQAGLTLRTEGKDEAALKEYEERMESELRVITQMGFSDYFLIVWDFIRYAKERDIAVGPGRGSAVGSLVSYCLDITAVDPMEHGLLFERFLNEERVSMPDIDIDFCVRRRQEVIDYVADKYGHDSVAQIITFGTMAPRQAVRDVARALNIPYSVADNVAKMIPNVLKITIDKAIAMNEQLKIAIETDETVAQIIDLARQMEGIARHASTHAAGVVIADASITNYVPLYVASDDEKNSVVTTQFSMGYLEQLGLLKMDFLGLRNLTIIRDCIDNIKTNRGFFLDIDHVPYDEKSVYDMISAGDTMGIFQLESTGMRQFITEMKPTCFEDITAAVALFRPGPMESIPTYVRNKKNHAEVKYIHPKLEPILSMTYGCIVYQEQVMQIVRDIAGYSMGQSDILRRAMSKKQVDVMAQNEETFIHGQVDEDGNVLIEGAVRRGVDAASAKKIFDQMETFAQYAFNKSHAAAYAVIAYQTGYLKALYPVEYMASLLTAAKDSEGKVAQYINDCKERGVDVLPPDINESDQGFTAVGEKIRFGLGAVKHVGDGVVKEIIAQRREKGPFKNFYDFADRMGTAVNKKAVEYLIMAGAFDFGDEAIRATLFEGYEKVLAGAQARNKNSLSGQMSLFGDQGLDTAELAKMEAVKPWDSRTRIRYEKEAAGIYMSGHPLDEYRRQLQESVTVDSTMLADEEYGLEHDGQSACVGGVVTEVRTIMNKRGDPMAFMTVEDTLGKIDVVVFTDTYRKKVSLLKKDSIVLVRGRISAKENQAASIIAQDVIPLAESEEAFGMDPVSLELGLLIKIESHRFQELREEITAVLKRYPGKNIVYLHFFDIQKKLKADASMYVELTDKVIDEIDAVAGAKTASWI